MFQPTKLSVCAALLSFAGVSVLTVSGCGRLANGNDDGEGFGTYGSGAADDGDSDGEPGEPPGAGGSASESCYDGVLEPGEYCQVQPPEDINAGIDPCSLSVADFDGDGRPDVAVPNSDFFAPPGATHVTNILRGYGTGEFAPANAWDAGLALPVGLTVGDFDGDGRPDVATANHEANAAYVLRNLGGLGTNMGFGSPSEVDVSATASSITSGDLDGDGLDDLIINTPEGIALMRTSPDGGASWFDMLDFGTGIPIHSVVVDIDEDGHLDLATAVVDVFSTDRLVVFQGAGDGSFPEQVEYPLAGDPAWVTAGDLNMDGDVDLAVAESEENRVALMVGNARGGFSPRTEIPVCLGPQSVAIGDMNNDGANDFVVACSDDDEVQMWLQVEDGKFEKVRWWGTGDRPVSVQVADFNLDGQLDLAWANQLSNTVGVVISRI